MEPGSQVESKDDLGVGGLSGQETGGTGWISNNSKPVAVADRLKVPITPFSVLDRHQIDIVAARRKYKSKIRPEK